MHARKDLPGGLKLAAIGDVLDNALVRRLRPCDLGQRQLETNHGDPLQYGRVQLKGKALRCPFGIEVLVPSKLGVVPGIAELASYKVE